MPDTCMLLEGLPQGRRYFLTLSAVGASGSGPRVRASVAVAVGTQPVAEQDLPEEQPFRPALGLSEPSQDQPKRIHLEWPAPSGDCMIVGYRIRYRPMGSTEEWLVLVEDTMNAEPFAMFDVPSSIECEFSVDQITPCGIAGEEGLITVSVPGGCPGLVRSVRVIEVQPVFAGVESMTAIIQVFWSAPLARFHGHDAPILRYRVTLFRGDADTIAENVHQPIFCKEVSASTTNTQLAGFRRDAVYTAVIVAVNAFGAGPGSARSFSVAALSTSADIGEDAT